MIKRNIQLIVVSVSIVFMISLVSCDPAKKYEKEEASKIQDYRANNNSLNFDLKGSGLYYLEIQEGTGIAPVGHDTVYIKYTGKLLDGSVFDTNVGTSTFLIFPVGEGWVIPGFDEGVAYMKAGGKAMFLIPSSLAYGAQGSSYAYDPYYGYYQAIPGYTPLLFDIELVKVIHVTGK